MIAIFLYSRMSRSKDIDIQSQFLWHEFLFEPHDIASLPVNYFSYETSTILNALFVQKDINNL